MNPRLKGTLYLVACALVWGLAFTAQSTAMEHVRPITFVFARSTVTCLVLSAAMPLIRRLQGRTNPPEAPSLGRHLALGGVLGGILVAASLLQQAGLVHTTPAKSGFVTALYIVIVPILGLFLGRRAGLPVWIGVALSLAGLFLLCVRSDFSVNAGDLLTLGCAFVFAFHILLVDRRAGRMNTFLLSAIQFGAGAVIAGILAFIFETPRLADMLACWKSIAYVAVCSGAIGYTLQMLGQKYTDPTLASLLLCLESVFAALGGWAILGQTLTARELLGCALMLSASVVAQVGGVRKA